MNGQDPLARLHPLRVPAEPGWWPPAPGWWWLAAALLALLLASLVLALRRWRRNRYRRLALAALDREIDAWREHGDTGQLLAGVNAILKSASLRAFPRQDVAALSGEPWVTFLQAQCPKPIAELAPLADAPYRPVADLADPRPLLAAAATWLRRHRRPA